MKTSELSGNALDWAVIEAQYGHGLEPDSFHDTPATVRKPDETDYAYDVGVVLGAICARYGDKVTATAIGNISERPNLIKTYLRHLDLSDFAIPSKPDGWKPGAASSNFWIGYYHGRAKALTRQSTPRKPEFSPRVACSYCGDFNKELCK